MRRMYGDSSKRELLDSVRLVGGFATVAEKISRGVSQRETAPPTRRDAEGRARFDIPVALAARKLAGKLLIARLSVTVTTRRLANGGMASTGRVATIPKPVDPIAAAIPRFPSEATLVRVRRGATDGLARKQNMLYAVHMGKVSDAPHWLKGESLLRGCFRGPLKARRIRRVRGNP